MRYFIIALFLLSFVVGCSGQGHDSTIVEYRFRLFELANVPDTTGYNYVEFDDDSSTTIEKTVALNWQQGVEETPPWVSPNDRTTRDIVYIPNEPQIWDGLTASYSAFLVLKRNTWYECTITAYGSDIYDVRESDESFPVYIYTTKLLKPYNLVELRIF